MENNSFSTSLPPAYHISCSRGEFMSSRAEKHSKASVPCQAGIYTIRFITCLLIQIHPSWMQGNWESINISGRHVFLNCFWSFCIVTEEHSFWAGAQPYSLSLELIHQEFVYPFWILLRNIWLRSKRELFMWLYQIRPTFFILQFYGPHLCFVCQNYLWSF